MIKNIIMIIMFVLLVGLFLDWMSLKQYKNLVNEGLDNGKTIIQSLTNTGSHK